MSAPPRRYTEVSRPPEPAPLRPLGPTDSYSYPNGVIAYFSDDYLVIHASMQSRPVRVPGHAWPVIVAVAKALGLDDDEASLLAEAAEAQT